MQELPRLPNSQASRYLSLSLPRSGGTNRRAAPLWSPPPPWTPYWLRRRHASPGAHTRTRTPIPYTDSASDHQLPQPRASIHPRVIYKASPPNRLPHAPASGWPCPTSSSRRQHHLPHTRLPHSPVAQPSCLQQFCQNFEPGWFHNREYVQGWGNSARQDFHPPQLMGILWPWL